MSDRSGGRFHGSGPEVAQGLNLAFEFAGAVAIFWFVGRLIDTWLGIEPWAQVIGGVLGWLGGILHVYYKLGRKDVGNVGGNKR